MKPFKLHDLVIWIDEQSDDITGIITEVNEEGFRIDWESPSPYDERKNQVDGNKFFNYYESNG